MEDVLGPLMFEIPSADDISKVVITRESVVDGAEPLMVRQQTQNSAASSA